MKLPIEIDMDARTLTVDTTKLTPAERHEGLSMARLYAERLTPDVDYLAIVHDLIDGVVLEPVSHPGEKPMKLPIEIDTDTRTLTIDLTDMTPEEQHEALRLARLYGGKLAPDVVYLEILRNLVSGELTARLGAEQVAP
jgi:hypothetical protein